MDFKRFGSKYLVRLDRGEELVSSITDLVKKEKIRLGIISGIGAINKALIGLFRVDEKKYYQKEFTGDFEILNLSGNISEMDGQAYLHFHITFGDGEFNAYGGHLNQAHVSATCEIIIDLLEGKVDRSFSDEVGLNLLKFE